MTGAPANESSKVTSALLLMSAPRARSTGLTDTGGGAPVEWHGVFPGDYSAIPTYSGYNVFKSIYDKKGACANEAFAADACKD